MVELKKTEIKKAQNRYLIHIPRALVEDSDVLKIGKKYRVLIEEIKGLTSSLCHESEFGVMNA